MTAFREASVSLVRTVAVPSDEERVGMGRGDPPVLTLGMLVPLLRSGRTTKCDARPGRLCDTGKR
jgi:hypothetical protein